LAKSGDLKKETLKVRVSLVRAAKLGQTENLHSTEGEWHASVNCSDFILFYSLPLLAWGLCQGKEAAGSGRARELYAGGHG
jgi:hypothetical protein